MSKRRKVQITFPKKTPTKQSFKDECDINKIMARYKKTGSITHLNGGTPTYGFATEKTFTESMHLVQESRDLFSELPSEIRDQFRNNPAEFLAFCENPDNRPEMAAMGLLTEEAAEAQKINKEPVTGSPEPKAEKPSSSEDSSEPDKGAAQLPT